MKPKVTPELASAIATFVEELRNDAVAEAAWPREITSFCSRYFTMHRDPMALQFATPPYEGLEDYLREAGILQKTATN
jgi:hypothetical protein